MSSHRFLLSSQWTVDRMISRSHIVGGGVSAEKYRATVTISCSVMSDPSKSDNASLEMFFFWWIRSCKAVANKVTSWSQNKPPKRSFRQCSTRTPCANISLWSSYTLGEVLREFSTLFSRHLPWETARNFWSQRVTGCREKLWRIFVLLQTDGFPCTSKQTRRLIWDGKWNRLWLTLNRCKSVEVCRSLDGLALTDFDAAATL